MLDEKISDLRSELDSVLQPTDPRWLKFFDRIPGDPRVPEKVEEVTATAQPGGIIDLDWSDTARAARYRVLKQVVGTDTDFVVVLTNGSGQTCTLSCLASLCPENFAAKVVNGRVELSWDNLVKAWDHFEISRDGTVMDAAVPASTTKWTDPNVILMVGNSYDYLLHPVAAPGGEFPPPMTQCDRVFTLGYAPEVGKYDPPAGGWDYVLSFSQAGPAQFNPNVGETGNLDGKWILGRIDS